MRPDYVSASLGAAHILSNAGSAREGEKILLLVDPNTEPLSLFFANEAERLGYSLTKATMPVGNNHGEEPPDAVANEMRASSLVIALTTFSLAHSAARIEAAAAGARFLSLPQYSLSLLGHKMIRVNYRLLAPVVSRVADSFSKGSTLHLSSRAGTDLTVRIEGRKGNYAPAFVEFPGDLGSPPDIEANVSPLEDSATGVAVIDGSITHPSIGLLNANVAIEFQQGLAVSFETDDKALRKKLGALFDREDWRRRILAEVGVGLNPEAVLTGAMLSDEGTLGTAHLGLGSNFYVGGKNRVDFHLDFVIRDASLRVDRNQVLAQGELVIEN